MLREGTSSGGHSFAHAPVQSVVFAALLIPAGRIADLIGRRRVFLSGLGLFMLGSSLCAAAPSVQTLIAARVLARPRLLREDNELGYLLRVLRNTYLTQRRTASRRPQVTTTLEQIHAADPRTETQPEQALAARQVYAAVAELPEPFRLALVAVDVVGLSYREAARSLGAREATITTRLHRARQRIALTLDARDANGTVSDARDHRLTGDRIHAPSRSTRVTASPVRIPAGMMARVDQLRVLRPGEAYLRRLLDRASAAKEKARVRKASWR